MMYVPPEGLDGERITINSNLGEDDTLWQFRSAWNVAALNCSAPQYQPITDAYGAFLKRSDRALDAANAAIDRRFREEHGSRSAAIRAREAYMTQVYNYFALPPARSSFCTAALEMATEALASPPEDPQVFAATNLQRFEAVFDQFFDEYEQYRAAAGEWDAQYGAQYGASQPGYVAVHGTPGAQLAETLANSGVVQPTGEVVDGTTGARIPLSSGPEEGFATPVVQPIPQEPEE